jgi:hypothetical protein
MVIAKTILAFTDQKVAVFRTVDGGFSLIPLTTTISTN